MDMGSPPKKRIRRAAIISSDDEDSTADSQLSNASLNVTTRRMKLAKDSQQSDSLQQKPARSKSKTSNDNKPIKPKGSTLNGTTAVRNSTLYSFFNSVTSGSSQSTVKPRSPQRKVQASLPDDAIEDISSDDAKSDNPLAARERRKPTTSDLKAACNGSDIDSSSVSRSKQFAEAPKNAVPPANPVAPGDTNHRHWAELYPPENLDELAVHKRKITDVHKWLDNVLKGRERKRLLVLKGPSGSGRTATLRLLAQDLKTRLVEWENPVGSSIEDEGFVSLAAQFEEFLTRSINFQGLELTEGEQVISNTIDPSEGAIVLIEDFPNTFARGSSALMTFRDNVLRYLAASTPAPGFRASDSRITPVVMIVTETHTTSSINQSESFTVGKLLGPQLLQHPSVTVIEFNPIAPTIISKAIATIIKKLNRSRSTRWFPSADVIKKISQSGDIRSSINSLQLTHLYEQGQIDHKPEVESKSKRTSKKRTFKTIDQMTPPTIDFRDDMVDLFHAVGKILYNKRTDIDANTTAQPPIHLRQHFRRKISEVSVNALYDDIASNVETFTSALHENYPLSCYGDEFTDTLDDCINHLSDSDLLLSSGNDNSSTRTLGKMPPSPLQTEYSFQTASRGLLFALPYPVERGKTMSSALSLGRDPFKMLYPAALRLWRSIDDNETIVDDWIEHLQRSSSGEEGSCMRISRTETVTQFLPYAARINANLAPARPGRKGVSTASTAAGVTGARTTALDGEDDDAEAIGTLSVPVNSSLALPLPPGSSSMAERGAGAGIRFGNQFILPAKKDQLVLSDDDIEDD